jgi:hypothetical protein
MIKGRYSIKPFSGNMLPSQQDIIITAKAGRNEVKGAIQASCLAISTVVKGVNRTVVVPMKVISIATIV